MDVAFQAENDESGGREARCGSWRLLNEVGRGAYGSVHLAEGPDGRRAAVKVCRRDAVGDERYERELRGAKLYRAIPPQEGLVRMMGLAEADWGFYTVMDLADDEFGGPQDSKSGYRPKTLARVIEGEKALPLKECVKLALSLANGLAALQRHHLLHRDIKPANVLYVGGRPILSDPGLLVEESAAASLVGTPGYVPPERFTDASSDIYSLGLTLKAASFGRRVEDLDKGPSVEADTGAALFPAWWRILNKATDQTPSRRYQSAKALLKDLKILRMRIALAATVWSWGGKIAIALLVLALIVTSTMSSVRQLALKREIVQQKEQLVPLKKFKDNSERQYNINLRDAQWSIDLLRPGDLYNRSMIDDMRRDLRTIAEADKSKAAEFESSIEKFEKLFAKYESLSNDIKKLWDKVKDKPDRGIDDDVGFLQAQQISKEREKLYKNELAPLFKEIHKMKDRILDEIRQTRRK